MRMQTNTTIATLQATRESRPHPLCLLELIGWHPNSVWDVQISAIGDSASVRFHCCGAEASWPIDLLCSGAFPELFSFGRINYGHEGRHYSIDVLSELDRAPSEISIAAKCVGDSESPWLEIRVEHGSRDLLRIEAVVQWLRRKTWVGTLTRVRLPAVRLRVLSTAVEIGPPVIMRDAAAATRLLRVGGKQFRVELFCSDCRSDRKGVQIRHALWGEPPETIPDVSAPQHLSWDVIVYSECSDKVPLRSRCDAELFQVRSALTSLLKTEWEASEWYEIRRRVEERLREQEVIALRGRVRRLEDADYVVLPIDPDKPLIRVPTNEQELVCLFMMLLQANAIPFDFRVLEYSAKTGIDAIADFTLHRGRVGEMRAPVEFEFLFGNFLAHRHPPGQVKLIICWNISGEDLEDGPQPWIKIHNAAELRIPVVVVSKLPSLRIVSRKGVNRGKS